MRQARALFRALGETLDAYIHADEASLPASTDEITIDLVAFCGNALAYMAARNDDTDEAVHERVAWVQAVLPAAVWHHLPGQREMYERDLHP